MPKKKVDAPADEVNTIDWDNPSLYFNRELSFLLLNLRVLEEALDERHPLLERVKFLSIYSNNLDEFFMIRVSGLYKQLLAGVVETPPDGMTPAEQLAAIRREILPPLTTQMNCWQNDLLPKLDAEGIHILKYEDLKGKQRKLLRRYFEQEIFPVLTPLAFDPGHPFPHISNLSINLAVVVRDAVHGELFARLKIPGVFPRLLRIPEEEKADDYDPLGLKTVVDNNFVWIEEVVAANLGMLFPGVEVVAAYPFRVTRDADLEIEEDEAADLLETIAEGVERRQFGSVVRLEVDKHMPKNVRDILFRNLEIPPYLVYTADGPIGLADVMILMSVDRPDLKDAPFVPYTPRSLSGDE
ncbi:MAG TPA: hypothetical protein VLM78_10410, partial [Anaerolineales bacterium]|nr:hypothetical protein [Anaerolineales bacterium]